MTISRSLSLAAPRHLAWVDAEIGRPGPGEVFLRTEASAVSVGSELPVYRGDQRHLEPVVYPAMTGYEDVATVLAVGEGVADLRPGERVIAFYGHRSHAVVPRTRAVAIPVGATAAEGLLAILSCDVAKGVRRLGVGAGEPVLVTGAGALGILAVFVLRAYGVASVDVVDVDPARLRLAAELGAARTGTPEEFGGDEPSYAVGFECSNTNSGFRLLQRRMRPLGRVCVIADGNVEPLELDPAFHARELAIAGTSDGWDYHQHVPWYFEHLPRFPALSRLFDLEIPADRLPETFEAIAAGRIRPRKVLVHWR